MKRKGHVIKAVEAGSIADELELEPGDRLLTIDGEEIQDIFDYQYKINSEAVTLVVQKAGGEEWELEIENEYEDLGLTFENGLMSDYRTCHNKCMFCFIDQMPPGMRETLYLKDDDSRLSFLQGNYVTLTNMGEEDIERIIRFKLSPINISVHTTNPALRCRMLNNRFAGEALKKIDTLYEAGTPMNGQIVLCKGINDGEELERTIRDLSRYIPCMESVSVVPVGLTRFRDGLCPLNPITGRDAAQVLEIVERWQKKLCAKKGIHFIHASDEFYMLADRPMPEAERYDGFIQLENGVGMTRLMTDEIEETLKAFSGVKSGRTGLGEGKITERAAKPQAEEISLATGMLAFPYIGQYLDRIREYFPHVKAHLYAIRNDFFGERITVAGLITGGDLIHQLKGKPLGKRLLLPEAMFRSGEEVFLDDLTREDVQKALQVQVDIVKSSGRDFVEAVIGARARGAAPGHGRYELRDC